MTESQLHRNASRILKQGDASGQAFGESIRIADRTPANRAIKDYSAAHRRRPDMRFWTPEGLEVLTEYSLGNPLSKVKVKEKEAEYREAKKVVLEVALHYSEGDLKQWLAAASACPQTPEKRFVYVPAIHDIVRLHGGAVEDDGMILDYGRLGCAYPGCTGRAAYTFGAVFVKQGVLLETDEWPGRRERRTTGWRPAPCPGSLASSTSPTGQR